MTASAGLAAGERETTAAANPFDCDDTISPMVKTVSPSKTLEVRTIPAVQARGYHTCGAGTWDERRHKDRCIAQNTPVLVGVERSLCSIW